MPFGKAGIFGFSDLRPHLAMTAKMSDQSFVENAALLRIDSLFIFYLIHQPLSILPHPVLPALYSLLPSLFLTILWCLWRFTPRKPRR